MEKRNDSLDILYKMPVPQAVLKNAVPSMIAMMMVLIYNLADTFFIGQTHDSMQVAAISLASQIFVFYTAIGTMFGIGGTSVISRSLGAGDMEYSKKVSSFCMWGGVFTGIVVSALMWFFINPLLQILGADTDTWVFTKDYLMIVALSGPFIVIGGCFSNILRAEGQPVKAMVGQLIGNLTNIILDPVFILVFGLNTKGAAIATVIGNLVGAFYYIIYFLRGKSILSIRFKDFTVKEKVCRNVLVIGIPASLNSLFISISHMVLNRLMVGYGNLQLAGIGVATNLMKISGLLCIGYGQGIQPLIGYCVGAKDSVRCKKVIRFSLISGFLLSLIMTVFSYMFIDQLVGMFLTEADAFEYGVQFAEVMLTTSFLFGVFYVLTNVLQGFGAATASLFVNISRQGLIYIPALFIMQSAFGMDGLALTQPLSDVLATILVVVLYIVTQHKMDRNKEDGKSCKK